MILKFQVSAAHDSVLPRDRIINTLYFNRTGTALDAVDANKLCADLATIFNGSWYSVGYCEINVRCYEVKVGPDGPPIGEATVNKGVAPVTNAPREIALCLSYYAGRNTPRTRGRIFLPAFIDGLLITGRPNAGTRDKALGLVPKFAALGGIDVNWVVHSPTSNTNPGVTNAWVDDEWDTIRSRGLRATTRSQVATGG